MRVGLKIGLLALCATLAVTVGSASAARTFNTNVNEGFGGANAVAFDANNDVWISDNGHFIPNQSSRGQNGLYEMDPFPSQNLLEVPDTFPAWEFASLAIEVAVDQSNGEVFASQANGRAVDIFKNGVLDRAWTGINEVAACCPGDVHIAIDNSNGFSRGRVYLSLTTPENDIEVLDAGQRPVDFPATAGYIKGNRLIGTPSGVFGQVEQVSVDSRGNLFVVDAGKGLLDEFDSSGTFLRSFPDSEASGGYPGTGGAGIDPTNGDVLISTSGGVKEYDAYGNLLGTVPSSTGSGGTPGVNSDGYLYVPTYEHVGIYNPAAPVAVVSGEPVTSPTPVSGTLNAKVDPNGGGAVTECKFEYGTTTAYGTSKECAPAAPFSATTAVSAAIAGLTTGTTYHYRTVVKDATGTSYSEDRVYTPGHVLDLSTDPATEVEESSATLEGSFVGSGEDTHYFYEWGPTETYGHTTEVAPGVDAGSPPGPGRTALPAELTGLSPYSTYHYRVVASNSGGFGAQFGADRTFTTTPGIPTGRNASVTAVHSDRAELHGEVSPNGGNTVAKFEYVDDEEFQKSGWSEAQTSPAAGTEIGMGKGYQAISAFVDGLRQGTLYHYRAEGTNGTGSGGVEATFRTFPFIPSLNDPCPNAHVRQQTGASLLLDCRGYELVSSANTGGYDVESSLVASQTPFASYPEAHRPAAQPNEEPEPQVLYGVHDGGIPGTGSPTNRGVDPYVATRTATGWKTRYVGIPANDPYAGGPFTSSLTEAASSLETLAFGGSEICAPCFADGSTGSPIHTPDGSLVQGMAGSLNPGPSAKPSGYVGRIFSADGTHFVFGSTSKFEPDGNEGAISIYDRDLTLGQTHVVSKLPGGGNIACTIECSGDGVGELDISGDGSRTVVGQLISDEAGARYWHLYMDIGDAGNTIDLTPGTTSGALFDGMTADGSKVFFTTRDQLLPADTDHSADIYEAQVDSGGNVTLTLVSTGTEGAGNEDACDPAANTARKHWNAIAEEENCGVVAVGGGGGVASGDGTIYFLSPETLDGAANGVPNAPNLYVARPGSSPEFVATLESSLNAPLPPATHSFVRSFGGPLGRVAGVATDDATGDTYALDIGTNEGTGYVYKFDQLGHPVLSFGINGKLTVGGMLGFYNLPCALSVDNDPASPNYGDLYVPSEQSETVGQYDSNGGHLATIKIEDAVTGTAVDAATGDLYVSGFSGNIYKYDTAGNRVATISATPQATGLAVGGGKVYVVNGGGFGAKGTTEIYDTAGNHLGQLDGNPSYAVAIDPTDGHIYVDEGTQATEFDPSGNVVGAPTGSGIVSGSFGIGVDEGRVFMGNPSRTNVASFGPPAVAIDPRTDNPLVVDSVSAPSVRHSGDFQVTPSGAYAAFAATLPLTGYNNADHNEVYRYDAAAGQLECASCNPTSETATGDAALAAGGLSLTDDGRVFFNSDEGLVDRDLNEQEDAYEWEPAGFQAEYEHQPVPGRCEEDEGCVNLISSGTALLGSKLLGATADGTDAYFFTRDTLVSEDQNGNRVKIYDARTDGGYPQTPEPVPCKASDECHGPGSQAPPEPEIKSVAVTPGGNATETSIKCKGKSVKKHGKCVKKRKPARHHRRHGHKGGSK